MADKQDKCPMGDVFSRHVRASDYLGCHTKRLDEKGWYVVMNINTGEIWYIRRPFASAIVKVEILDVSQNTAQVREHGEMYAKPERYTLDELKWIERL